MKNNVFKGALVGCGVIANHIHISGWKSSRYVEIVAVCDPNEEAAISTAKQWNIPKVYTDFSRMLDTEKLDFIDICTPPMTHFDLAIKAMQAGIHVVVEKPMASNVNEAEEMVSTAKKNNVKLCVIHNLLFSPVLQQARKMVDKGTIGDILNIDIKHLCIKDRHLGIKDHWCHDPDWLGGTLHELAPHPLYLARAFLGDISSINAITRKYCDHPWVRADEMEVILKGERGLGSFHISYNSPREFLSLNIIGTGGFIYIDHITQILILRRPRSNNLPGLLMDRLDITLPVLTSTAYGAAYRIRGKIRNRSGHVILIQKFIECMRNDIEPPVTGEDGFKNVTMLDEIWKQVD